MSSSSFVARLTSGEDGVAENAILAVATSESRQFEEAQQIMLLLFKNLLDNPHALPALVNVGATDIRTFASFVEMFQPLAKERYFFIFREFCVLGRRALQNEHSLVRRHVMDCFVRMVNSSTSILAEDFPEAVELAERYADDVGEYLLTKLAVSLVDSEAGLASKVAHTVIFARGKSAPQDVLNCAYEISRMISSDAGSGKLYRPVLRSVLLKIYGAYLLTAADQTKAYKETHI